MLDPRPGARIGGRYLLLERLGAGGMGEVWLAVLEGSGTFRRKVVVKFVPHERVADRRLLTMLADEARILGLLHHPNIVAPVDYVEDDDGPVLVLEYIDGPSLRMALRQARRNRALMPEALAAWVGAEVARALHAAHCASDEAGQPLQLIHRDVSPDNVLFSRDGRVHLADFGVARASVNEEVTVPGAAPKGKRGYMAPEQAAGRLLLPSADVFSLGRVVAEAADVNCSYQLRALLDRATAPRPEDRFQTAGGLAEALGAVCPPPPDPTGALQAWLAQACAETSPGETAPGAGRTPSNPALRRPVSVQLEQRPAGPPPLAGRPATMPRPLFDDVGQSRRPRALKVVAGGLALLAVALPLALVAEARGLHLQAPVVLSGLRAPRCELQVRSRPETAEVYVDGQLRGTTPLWLQLSEGRHALRVGSLRLERWRASELNLRAGVVQRVEVDLTE